MRCWSTHEALGRLESARKRERLAALRDLELANCQDLVPKRAKVLLAQRLADAFHSRDHHERAHVARFLDAWLAFEPSSRLHRRLLAARMEEVDEAIRENLYAAACHTMPNARLLAEFAAPPPEAFLQGAALLILLECVAQRLRRDAFSAPQLAAAIRSLRAARAYRASHIGRPFLWKLEAALRLARQRRSRLRRSA